MSLNNGVKLTATQAYQKSYYTGYTGVWVFSDTEFPKLLPAQHLTYPGMSGIDYSVVDAYDAIRAGKASSLASMNYSYLQSTAWNNTGEYPILIQPPMNVYDRTIKPIDYSYWALLEELTYGKSISKEKSNLIETYSANGWNTSTTWYFDEGVLYPYLSLSTPEYNRDISPIDYTWINGYDAIRFGGSLADKSSKSAQVYMDLGFNFSSTWGIQSGLEPPTLLSWYKHTPISDPLSSTAWEVMMTKDVKGTGNMYFEDSIWGPAYPAKPIEVKGGTSGTQIKHDLPKKISRVDLSESEREYYIYIGVGVENPNNPSGYDPPQQLTSVSTTLVTEGSSDVAFYYNKVYSPDYDYLVQVSSDNPNAPYHLIVTQKDPSSIKLRLPNKQYGWFRLVPLSDPFSSPIKVKTTNGVMSIQSPDINESLFEVIDTDHKPSVAFITKEVGAPENAELVSSLEKLGYNVVLISDSTASAKKFGSFDKYDVIVIGRTTSKEYISAVNFSRKPIILGYAVESAITLQWEMGMTQGEPYHTESTVPTTQAIINNSHLITKPFSIGQTFNPYKSIGNNFVGVINNTNNEIIGEPLIQSTNHPLGKGAISLSAKTTELGQRRVYMGFLYKDFSEDTLTLLGRALKWVTFRDNEL